MRKYKVICPLINFQIPKALIGSHKMTDEEVTNFFKEREKQLVKGIDLVHGVKIRRISKENLEDLRSSIFPLPLDLRELISPKMFVLEKHITVEDDHDFQLDKVMRNVVLGLRLLKGGHVFGNYRLYFLLSKKKQLKSWSREDGQMLEDWRTYALNFEEISTLKKIVKKLQSVDFSKRKSLHLVCKRFQRAYEESDAEDQLIDLMIAFEALFLKGEKAVSPAGQIIAVACSTLLGKDDKEREEIRTFLTKAYSIRNCIVHGAEYKKPYVKREYGMSEFVSKIEDYLRESIKKLLD